MYRISRWDELYKPSNERYDLDGPLKYVMWAVHGHSQSESYRLLWSLAEIPELAGSAFGLFAKLLEIAADEPKTRRDGTIYFRDRPAEIRHISVMSCYPEPICKSCLELLCHPEIGWVECTDAASTQHHCSTDAVSTQHHCSTDAASTQHHCSADAASTQLKGGDPTETELKYKGEQKSNETEHAKAPLTRPSVSVDLEWFRTARIFESPMAGQRWKYLEQLVRVCTVNVANTFQLRPQDDSVSDAKALYRSIRQALKSNDLLAGASDMTKRIDSLARSKIENTGLHNPIAAFMADMKTQFGEWNNAVPNARAAG